MRGTRGRFDPRWMLALAVGALAGAAARAADPPDAPAAQSAELVGDSIEILVEEETDQVGDEDTVADDAGAERQVPQLLERLLEGVLQAVPEAIDPTAHHRRAVLQQATQLEQMFRPLLHLELALARQSCPGLAPDARRAVAAAGQQAVKKFALAAATAMLAGRPPRADRPPRRAIHDAIATALRARARPEEFARYEKEAALGWARREEAARLRIVLKLDEEIDLSAVQREAVLAALRSGWQAEWMTVLDEHDGMGINGRRIAPDFATSCIEPHLTDEQKREWAVWCRTAGRRLLGVMGGFPGNVQGPPQPDAWWTP